MDAQQREERRRNLVEYFVEKAENDDYKVNCTFTPNINVNSRAMMSYGYDEDLNDREKKILSQT